MAYAWRRRKEESRRCELAPSVAALSFVLFVLVRSHSTTRNTRPQQLCKNRDGRSLFPFPLPCAVAYQRNCGKQRPQVHARVGRWGQPNAADDLQEERAFETLSRYDLQVGHAQKVLACTLVPNRGVLLLAEGPATMVVTHFPWPRCLPDNSAQSAKRRKWRGWEAGLIGRFRLAPAARDGDCHSSARPTQKPRYLRPAGRSIK